MTSTETGTTATERAGAENIARWTQRWHDGGACPCWWGEQHTGGHCCFHNPAAPQGDCHDAAVDQIITELPAA